MPHILSFDKYTTNLPKCSLKKCIMLHAQKFFNLAFWAFFVHILVQFLMHLLLLFSTNILACFLKCILAHFYVHFGAFLTCILAHFLPAFWCAFCKHMQNAWYACFAIVNGTQKWLANVLFAKICIKSKSKCMLKKCQTSC